MFGIEGTTTHNIVSEQVINMQSFWLSQPIESFIGSAILAAFNPLWKGDPHKRSQHSLLLRNTGEGWDGQLSFSFIETGSPSVAQTGLQRE